MADSPDSGYNDAPLDARDPDDFFPQNDKWGVPIFKPTIEEFADFGSFIKRIEHWGARRGLVKVVPPQEYLDAIDPLGNFPDALDQTTINKPIKQMISPHQGRVGVFTQANMEVSRTYSYAEWAKMALQHDKLAPHLIKNRGQDYTQIQVDLVHPKKRRRDDEDAWNNKPKLDSKSHQDILQNLHKQYPEHVWPMLEKAYWKTVSFAAGTDMETMYGADQRGSLMADIHLSEKLGDSWNIERLGLTERGNLLHRLQTEVAGVNRPYLYFGMWKATFGWHLEDVDLFSINVLHLGAPKHWYTIPSASTPRFEKACRELFSEEHRRCPEFMRHKGVMISPEWLIKKHGFVLRDWESDASEPLDMTRTILRCVQTQGEFMITFPYAYHAGFNYGLNCAEACNFALPSWKEVGKRATWCHCVDYTVKIDVNELLGDDDYDSADEDGMPLAKRTPAQIETTTLHRQLERERMSSMKLRMQRMDQLALQEEEMYVKCVDPRKCVLCPFGQEWKPLLPVLYESLQPDVEVLFKRWGIEGQLWAHAVCADFVPELSVASIDGYAPSFVVEEAENAKADLEEFRRLKRHELEDLKLKRLEDLKAEEEYQEWKREERKQRRIAYLTERGLEYKDLEKPVKKPKVKKEGKWDNWEPVVRQAIASTAEAPMYEAVVGIESIPKSRWDLVCDVCKKRENGQDLQSSRGPDAKPWDELGSHVVSGVVRDEELFPPMARLRGGCSVQCCHANCPRPFHVSCAQLAGLQTRRWVEQTTLELADGPVQVPVVKGKVYCSNHDPKRIHERRMRAIAQQRQKLAQFKPGTHVWVKSSSSTHVAAVVLERIESSSECLVEYIVEDSDATETDTVAMACLSLRVEDLKLVVEKEEPLGRLRNR